MRIKEMVEVEKVICDVCKSEETWAIYSCYGCGKDVCKNCRIDYLYSLWLQGSFDGKYCLECNANYRKEPNELYSAYVEMQGLLYKYKGFLEEIGQKADQLSKHIEEECRKRNL